MLHDHVEFLFLLLSFFLLSCYFSSVICINRITITEGSIAVINVNNTVFSVLKDLKYTRSISVVGRDFLFRFSNIFVYFLFVLHLYALNVHIFK